MSAKSNKPKKSGARKKKTELAESTPLNARNPQSDRIVRSHVVWSMGAGLLPIPLLDIAAVTAIQLDAINQLAKSEGAEELENETGKKFVAALTGGTFARLGASLVKGIPGVGTVIGGLSMSAFSAASTYAVCQVAIHHFRNNGGSLELDLNMDRAKELYESALDKGRDFVKSLDGEVDKDEARDAVANLQKLKDLHEAGVLTDKEYERKKEKLLKSL